MVRKTYILRFFLCDLPVFSHTVNSCRERGRETGSNFPLQNIKTPDYFVNKNEKGHYRDNDVEYLYEISKYTGWQYKFVDCGGGTPLPRLRRGQDILPVVLLFSGTRKNFCSPTGR